MRKIAIIGIGHVGSTVAYSLIQRGLVDEIVLFDKDLGRVDAEINDLLDGQVNTGYKVHVYGNDLSALKTCDLIIHSAGDISILKTNSDRFAELNITHKIAHEWGLKIKESGFSGILLNITNPCDVITRYLQELSMLPSTKVFGTGTSLDTARMKHAVSEYLSIHSDSVQGYVLGEHGESQFTAWSTVRIADQAISQLLQPQQLLDLENQARAGGWRTITGKGYTSYGIANQTAMIVQMIFSNNRSIHPVSCYQQTQNGKKLYVSSPALISRQGIEKIYPLTLNDQEQQKWQHSINRIQEMYEAIPK